MQRGSYNALAENCSADRCVPIERSPESRVPAKARTIRQPYDSNPVINGHRLLAYLKKKYHVVLSEKIERLVEHHGLLPARILRVPKLEQQVTRLGGQRLDILLALQRAKVGARIRSDRRLVHEIAGMNLKIEDAH